MRAWHVEMKFSKKKQTFLLHFELYGVCYDIWSTSASQRERWRLFRNCEFEKRNSIHTTTKDTPLRRKLTLLRCVSKKSRIIFLPLLHHFGNEKRIGKVSKWVFCQRGLSNDNFSNYAFEAGGILLRVYPSSYGPLVQFLFSLQEFLSTVRPVIALGLTFPFNGCDHGIWKVPKVHFFYKIIFNQNIWHCCWYILETSRQSGCKLWRYKRTSAPFFDPIFVAFSISPWMSQYIFRHLSPSELFGVCYDIWSTSHPREWNEDFWDNIVVHSFP